MWKRPMLPSPILPSAFFITNTCDARHRQLPARRRQWDRPVCQGRGVSVSQDGPSPQPHAWVLFENTNPGHERNARPPPKPLAKRENRAKSLVLEYFTLSHLESKTGSKISS